MVYSWWAAVDAESQIRGASYPCRVEGRVALRLFYANFLGNASVPLYRRSVLERVGGYDPGLRARGAEGCEDWDLSLRVAVRSETGVAPGHLTGYRRAAGSMSGDVETMARSYEAIVTWVRAAWGDVPPAVFRWSRANFACYLASQCQRAGRYDEMVRWTLRALRHDPALLVSRATHRSLGLALARGFGADRLVAAVRDRRPTRTLALDDLAATLAETPWGSPWDGSTKPFDRVRARRWRCLDATTNGAGAVARLPVELAALSDAL